MSVSLKKPEPDDVIERGQAILPGDLLPLGIGPAVIGDRDLIDATVKLRHLHGQLRLDAESIRFEPQPLEDFGSEDLVPDLHITQIEIGHHVAEGSEEPIPLEVPEVEDTMGATMEPVAEDDIGVAI